LNEKTKGLKTTTFYVHEQLEFVRDNGFKFSRTKTTVQVSNPRFIEKTVSIWRKVIKKKRVTSPSPVLNRFIIYARLLFGFFSSRWNKTLVNTFAGHNIRPTARHILYIICFRKQICIYSILIILYRHHYHRTSNPRGTRVKKSAYGRVSLPRRGVCSGAKLARSQRSAVSRSTETRSKKRNKIDE